MKKKRKEKAFKSTSPRYRYRKFLSSSMKKKSRIAGADRLVTLTAHTA